MKAQASKECFYDSLSEARQGSLASENQIQNAA